MTDIIEAVAKALAQADGFHPEAVSNDEDSVPAWKLYVEMARAAIRAYEKWLRDALERSGDGCGEYGCGPSRIMDVIAEARCEVKS